MTQTNKQTGILRGRKKKKLPLKQRTNTDRQPKIVHVKQNKQSLCGEIPAGLLPPPQLATVGPPESGSPGLPKT